MRCVVDVGPRRTLVAVEMDPSSATPTSPPESSHSTSIMAGASLTAPHETAPSPLTPESAVPVGPGQPARIARMDGEVAGSNFAEMLPGPIGVASPDPARSLSSAHLGSHLNYDNVSYTPRRPRRGSEADSLRTETDCATALDEVATVVGLLVLEMANRSIRPFGVVVVGGRCCA